MSHTQRLEKEHWLTT